VSRERFSLKQGHPPSSGKSMGLSCPYCGRLGKVTFPEPSFPYFVSPRLSEFLSVTPPTVSWNCFCLTVFPVSGRSNRRT
jgi:hypothetical protein